MRTRLFETNDLPGWNNFIGAHHEGSAYHLAEWKGIIEESYGHKAYYLLAERPNTKSDPAPGHRICGILPLVHLKHFAFGNKLVSMPFLDHAGILAEDGEAESALIREAVAIGERLGAEYVELRHTAPLKRSIDSPPDPGERLDTLKITTRSHKIRMVLDLPSSSDRLMASFKSKLRSQIRRPLKDGLKSVVGGPELAHDFYSIWSINMRDLGSPVHSLKLLRNVLDCLGPLARVVMVYKDCVPLAGGVTIRFKDQMSNPWASSLKAYARMSPNMLLYWAMLADSCDSGCASFDLGRSSPDASTYKFKDQWGAKPTPLHWHYIPLRKTTLGEGDSEGSKREVAAKLWRKLPLPIAEILGPYIRKHISL